MFYVISINVKSLNEKSYIFIGHKLYKLYFKSTHLYYILHVDEVCKYTKFRIHCVMIEIHCINVIFNRNRSCRY